MRRERAAEATWQVRQRRVKSPALPCPQITHRSVGGGGPQPSLCRHTQTPRGKGNLGRTTANLINADTWLLPDTQTLRKKEIETSEPLLGRTGFMGGPHSALLLRNNPSSRRYVEEPERPQ